MTIERGNTLEIIGDTLTGEGWVDNILPPNKECLSWPIASQTGLSRRDFLRLTAGVSLALSIYPKKEAEPVPEFYGAFDNAVIITPESKRWGKWYADQVGLVKKARDVVTAVRVFGGYYGSIVTFPIKRARVEAARRIADDCANCVDLALLGQYGIKFGLGIKTSYLLIVGTGCDGTIVLQHAALGCGRNIVETTGGGWVTGRADYIAYIKQLYSLKTLTLTPVATGL